MLFAANLIEGFGAVLTPQNLLLAAAGVTLGTLVGVLPGIGPALTVALLLPITFNFEDPVGAFILFAGIYAGGMYGGSTTSILLNTPGESASVATAIEGFEMAKRGRGRSALATAAIGSFVAGTIGIIALTVLADPVASLAVKFRAEDYFALILFAFASVTALTARSLVRGFSSLAVGLLIGFVGIDQLTGQSRLTFGVDQLRNGVDIVIVAVGLFAVGEALHMASRLRSGRLDEELVHPEQPHGRWLSASDWRRSWKPWLRGAGIGFPLGAVPAGGAEVPTFLSFATEKKLAPEREWGEGAIEGVAGPEAANNASFSGTLVPLLTLGLPTSATAAIMLAAFQIFNLQPGPELFENNSELVWTLIASLYIANVMLLALNLPLIRVWVKVLEVPRPLLYAGILMFGTLGVYSLSGSVVEVLVMYAIGVLGFFMRRYDFPIAPVILGVIPGPLMETYARRALTASGDDFGVFFGRPFTVILMVLAVCGVRRTAPAGAAAAAGVRRRRLVLPSRFPGSARAPPSARADALRMTATTHHGLRAVPRPRAFSLPRVRPELAVLLVLAGALNLWALSRNGWANEYYAGAVRSMASSWHAFLYGALDSAGAMTVDKPPLALWVQALSVRVFGWSSWSMLVPQALMGVAAVALVYDLVRRRFGRAGGFAAGAVLALTPIAVAVSRHNNPDALLVLCVVGALWAVVRALEDGRVRWIVLAGLCAGLGFEAKMSAALLVVPALCAAWVWAAPADRGRGLLAGGAAMVVAGGAWPLLMALTPASARPWISGTSDNSIVSLILDYNGLGRLDGQAGGPGGGIGGGGGPFGGEAEPLRLLNEALGGQAGWLLGFALIAGLALLVATRLRRSDPDTGWLLAVGGSALTAAVAFSLAHGIFHPYYVAELAPFVAALVGAGVAVFARGDTLARVAGPPAIAGGVITELIVLDDNPESLAWLAPVPGRSRRSGTRRAARSRPAGPRPRAWASAAAGGMAGAHRPARTVPARVRRPAAARSVAAPAR